MKGRSVSTPTRRLGGLVLSFLLAASGAVLLVAATPAPAPQPFPPVLQVFKDTFNSTSTYARYTGFGGASVSISAGRLWVAVPSGSALGSAGLRMRLPSGGRGVRCLGTSGLGIPAFGGGRMLWTLYGFDAISGQEVKWFELEIEEIVTPVQGLKAGDKKLKVSGKKNGNVIFIEVKTDKDANDIESIRFDTKDSGKKIQAEVKFKDGTRVNSDWVDPEPGTIAGVDVSAESGELSADTTEGTEVHVESTQVAVPAPISAFEQPALTALEPHWLIQTHDADVVLLGRIERVGGSTQRLIDGEQRLRLRVEYSVTRELYGRVSADRVTVYHGITNRQEARRFGVGDSVLLFLKRNPEYQSRRWFFDFGNPAGVIPGSDINVEAVVGRIHYVHGGQGQ